MDHAQNATYLFQSPSRHRHNSESWWSAFFSILLLYEAETNPSFSLPIYTYTGHLGYWWGENLNVANLSFQNVQVEARLSAKALPVSEWPRDFLDLKPDLLILEPDAKRVTLIETKTIGAAIATNLALYRRVRCYLEQNGWSANLYYLLSHGHETRSDFSLIEQHQLRVILWEDVLRATIETPLAQIFDCDLAPYATKPVEPTTGDGAGQQSVASGPDPR